MAFKKAISSNSKFHKWTDPGESIEGTWLGVKEGQKYDNLLGQVLTDNDGTLIFSITSGLADMENEHQFPIGSRVRITFTGDRETKRGSMRVYDVEVDTSVAGVQPARANKPKAFKATDEDVPF